MTRTLGAIIGELTGQKEATEFERAIEVLTDLAFARRTSKSSEFNKPAGSGF